MSNIIVTILSILLVAVAVITGVYYLGDVLHSDTPQTEANMLISQSRQVFAADTEYMLDKGLGSFNDVYPDAPAIAGYTSGRVPILDLDTYSASSGLRPLDPTATAALSATGIPSLSISQLNGAPVVIYRINCRINNQDMLYYAMYNWTAPTDLTLASSASTPLVQMCLKVNAMTTLPAGLTYTASGLPALTALAGTCGVFGTTHFGVDSNGVVQTNYCYMIPGFSTTNIYYSFTN